MSEHASYVVCGSKSWNRDLFDAELSKFSGEWHFLESKESLTLEFLESIGPRYVFFLHWSWIVPEEIVNTFECVNFHMTDLPYGRGGSPLQNLILRGHTETKLTAHRMVKELDAGPVYGKEPLKLSGSAEEILRRANSLCAVMIKKIVREEPVPAPQTGEVTLFERRKPQQSAIPDSLTTKQLYDFVRMLDAEGYPPAFIATHGFRLEFKNATLEGDSLSMDVTTHPSSSSL